MSSQRFGAQSPTRLHLPDGSPNPAADDVVSLAELAGLHLDEWQRNVLHGALMVRPDGRFAAFECTNIVPRQNGKGALLEARQLGGLFLFNERLQIHTAHEFKTCFEHFRRVKDLVEGCPSLAKQVKIIRTGAGDQAIELKNGNRIRFLARSRSSGRGFSGDAVYFDEAFELSEQTVGALLPSLSARPNPQIWYTSSAPHADSTVLHRLRERGLAGGDPRLFYAEWSNEIDCDPFDPESWYRANPGLGIRITEEFVETESRSMSFPEFARERLGIPEGVDGGGGPISMAVWSALIDAGSSFVGKPALALDITPSLEWSSFGAAGFRADGLGHLEYVRREAGTGWVVDFAKELCAKWRAPLAVDPVSPAGGLLSELRAAGVKVVEVSHREHGQACASLLDAVVNGRLRHRGQVALADAVQGAVKRQSGDLWLWSRASSSVDVSPLVAVTLAWSQLHGRKRVPVVLSR